MAMKIIGKVNTTIKFLVRKAALLDKDRRKMIASSLIQCHFDACTSWYSSLPKQWKSKLQVSQNRLIRVVLILGSQEHREKSVQAFKLAPCGVQGNTA